MSSSNSSRGRTNSGRWSRLKHINQDPLEVIGWPSKGDNKRRKPFIPELWSDIWHSALMQVKVMSSYGG
ncbi:hypothetical protein HI914_05790 [Erysiphe necator]|nr:hypothetical protein HI914_05790 [Erysiphe necator]